MDLHRKRVTYKFKSLHVSCFEGSLGLKFEGRSAPYCSNELGTDKSSNSKKDYDKIPSFVISVST